MIVVLDGETFASPLINMAVTGRTIMSVIPLCMRQRNPTQKIAHFTVFSRLKNKMPVIGHQLVTQNATGIPLESFSKDLLERFIVGYLLEDLAPSKSLLKDSSGMPVAF